MKRYKAIETKNLKLELYEGDKMFFVIQDDKIVCSSKRLDSVLYYFDIAYQQFLTKNN